MELKSFQHNGISWHVNILGEKALLLTPDVECHKLSIIHHFCLVLDQYLIYGVVDIIPAYDSIGIIFEESLKNHLELFDLLTELPTSENKNASSLIMEVPVCYDLGLDWSEIENYTNLAKSEIIKIHSSKIYTVAMIGFIPGFLFLDGLDSSISCPRKSSPRTIIPKGSVGIGGNQTGVYSLESPGGWNIIGRTPMSFFEVEKRPPSTFRAGNRIKFVQISEYEFGDF